MSADLEPLYFSITGSFTFMATYVNLQYLLLGKVLWSGLLTESSAI